MIHGIGSALVWLPILMTALSMILRVEIRGGVELVIAVFSYTIICMILGCSLQLTALFILRRTESEGGQ